ncbi:MAG: PQQ-binding-like beta-propeller repeat protein [Verrucomicrobiota bacterium]
MNNSIPAAGWASAFLGVAAVSLFATTLPAKDWPQWRGPQRNGVSDENGLLAEWPPTGPALLWSVADLGAGYSTPAVVGNRLYLLGNEGLENEYVEARSVKNGQRLWSSRLGKVGNPRQEPNYPAARSTPTVVGKELYALGSDGDLVCLTTATGKARWRRSLRTDFGGKPGEWAYAESPLIDGDKLICTPGGTNATLVALNKHTGAVIWSCAVPGSDAATYSSAIVVEASGIRQYVQFLAKGLVGVDAKTGKFLWRYEKTALGSPAVILTPLAERDLIYSGAYRAGGGLVKLGVNHGTVQPEQLYFSPKLPVGVGGVVKVGEYLYGSTGQAYLCVDFASGTVKWEDRALAPAASCYADGRLYLHGENGDVGLVEPTPEGYREKGRVTPPEQPKRANAMEKPWAYPVVANGRLYIRDGIKLWCYDIRKPAGRNKKD